MAYIEGQTSTRTNGAEKSEPRRGKPYRRQKYLIKPTFQLKYAISISLVVFFTSCMMAAVLYGVLHHQARMRQINPHSYVANVTLVVCVSSLAFAALTTVGIGVWSIIVTHRICGPLHVMRSFLVELGNGRSPNLRPLRRKDEFKDFYEVFCNTVRSIEARRKLELAALTEALQITRPAVDVGEPACKDALCLVAERIEKLRNEMAAALGREFEEVGLSTVERPDNSPCDVRSGTP